MPCVQARVGIEGSGQVPQWASAVLVPSFFSISHAQPRPQPGRSARVTRFRRVRTLALLTKSLGANDHRHRATSGHVRPLSRQLDGTSGHTQDRPGTLRKCLLSSRSRVRVAVGAQVREYGSPDSVAGSQSVTHPPCPIRMSGAAGTARLGLVL